MVGLVATLLALPISPPAVAAREPLEGREATQRRRGSRASQTPGELPAEYHRIPSRLAVTRAELAVVLGVRMRRVLEQAAHARVVILTDTRDHWADRWIQTVARAGLMAPTPRHRFEPDRFLQRRELAEAIAAVVLLAAERDPARTRRWRDGEPVFVDMETTHINYQAAAAAVSTGVLDVGRGGFFRPTAFVNGAEVVEVVRRLEQLVRR